MRVAVTGANGFTGRYLLPELQRRGHATIALEADVTDAGALEAEIDGCRPDAIVHLAGRAFVDADDVDGFYAVNQTGTFHLLEAAARHVPQAHVLLASTAQVYGAQAAGLIEETQPMRPSNHYALSKAAMEMGSRFWVDRLRITIVRPFNYTGIGQEARYLVPKIVDHFRRRAAVIELGNIDVKRDFGDVRAVAAAYAGLLEAPAPPPENPAVVNVCTGRVDSVRDLLARLRTMTGHAIDVRINPAFVRANDVPLLGGRNDRLRAILPDWRAISVDDTLEWMLVGDPVASPRSSPGT